ncbi:MAG: hypothetical protein PVSMB2_16130 [Ktedonobacteraceae bacterium]
MMQCPNCSVPIDKDTVFCGNCGKQIAPLQATGETHTYTTKPEPLGDDAPTFISSGQSSPRPLLQRPVSHAPSYVPASDTPRLADTPPLPSQPPSRRTRSKRVILFAALILVLIAGGTVGAILFLKKNNQGGANANGRVTFVDGQNSTGTTDALHISINGLDAPPSGFQYDAWLVNEQSEKSSALGSLNAQGGTFSLNFAGDGGRRQTGTNLLGEGNKLEITLEQGNVSVPTGKTILAGTFPPQAFIHIKHLLFRFPTTPHTIGLLVGLQAQTKLLNAQALVLQSIATKQNATATTCAVQSIIDIVEGVKGPHFQQLPQTCLSTTAGDGFGLLGTTGYLFNTAAHASLAAHQPDTTDNIRQQAGRVEIATTNITGWVTTIEQDALGLLNRPTNTSLVQDIVTLADHAYHGVDTNNDGQVDPVNGEAGSITAYIQGQFMATLPLTPVA